MISNLRHKIERGGSVRERTRERVGRIRRLPVVVEGPLRHGRFARVAVEDKKAGVVTLECTDSCKVPVGASAKPRVLVQGFRLELKSCLVTVSGGQEINDGHHS